MSWQQRSRFRLALVFVVACYVCPFCGRALAVEFAEGAEFQRRLRVAVGLNWSQNPLRSGLENLSRANQIAIRLDRRVPPEQLIDFQASSIPFVELLDKLTQELALEWGVMDSLLVIGPQASAIRVEAIARRQREFLKQMPPERQRALVKRAPLRWERLAKPRELLLRLANEARVEIANPEAIPHDLWDAGETSSLAWIDRVTWLLNEFDLRLDWASDGRQARLEAIDGDEVWAHDYTRPLREVEQLPAGLSVQNRGAQIRVRGGFAQHHAISQWILRQKLLAQAPARNAPAAETVYELRIDNQPVGGVIKALCQKLGWTSEISPDAASKLNDRVSFQVKNATAEELIEAAVKPAGLAFRLRGKQLEIFPREP